MNRYSLHLTLFILLFSTTKIKFLKNFKILCFKPPPPPPPFFYAISLEYVSFLGDKTDIKGLVSGLFQHSSIGAEPWPSIPSSLQPSSSSPPSHQVGCIRQGGVIFKPGLGHLCSNVHKLQYTANPFSLTSVQQLLTGGLEEKLSSSCAKLFKEPRN